MGSPRSPAPVATRERHGLVDALRGFALLGILVVNMEFIVQDSDVGWSEYTGSADEVARWLIAALAQSKFYLLFSLLFGYGLAIQLRRATERGSRLGGRYARRMIGLAILGVGHALLFFVGDILVIYAMVGSLAYLFRHAARRTLLKWAAIVYGAATAFWFAIAGLVALEPDDPPTASAEAARVFSEGSFGEVVAQHASEWAVTLPVLIIIQGPSAFALFLVGVVLGRGDLLVRPEAHRRTMLRTLAVAGPIGLAGGALSATLLVGEPSGSGLFMLGFALQFAFAPFLTAAYVALLALGLGARPGRLARPMVAAGRMSLSVYLLESIVATTLAYGYGFGLFGEVGPWGGLALSLAIWLGLSAFAALWLAWARFGPFEWLLRSFSYARLQRLRAAPART